MIRSADGLGGKKEEDNRRKRERLGNVRQDVSREQKRFQILLCIVALL